MLPLTNLENLSKIIRKFFWKEMGTRKNIIWSNGTWFANLRRKVD
jgi:hypothetical protein